MSFVLNLVRRTSGSFLSVVLLLWMSSVVCGQSTELNFPTPVRTSEVVGRIAARDLGDSRLMDHFYAFTGTPGDVLIAIDSTNLNGDVDIFTAVGLKPLLKFALYAERSSPITKSIYLRRREDLILRVQARSPNDDEGVYHLRFGGSFEPIVGGAELSEGETPTTETAGTASAGKKTRRVSSVGARIDEPVAPAVEVASAPTPQPSETESANPKPVKQKPVEVESAKPAVPRAARSRRPANRRVTSPAPTKEQPADKKVETTESADSAASPPKGATRNKSRRGAPPANSPTTAETASPPEAESGPRLIIETHGGTFINRPMSGVRRVTVENGQVFVVGKDGKTTRLPLANIVKMSIEP